MATPGGMAKAKQRESLNGWQQIADFLGQPISVAERWAKSGMPVTHKGRRLHASRAELARWLGRESAGGARSDRYPNPLISLPN
jgi:phage terminase Nu1 subunit (DNA packaging protein)